MRVLHVTPEFPPVIWGGLGTAVGGLVTASAHARMTVGVLLVGGVLSTGQGYGGWQPVTLEHVTSERLRAIADPNGIDFFQVSPDDAAEEAIRLVKEWRPDVVHLHTAWLWHVARAIQGLGIPLVFTVHSLDRAEYEIGHLPTGWEDQEAVIGRADRVIALSGSERELVLRYCPAVGDRLRIVGNGIDDPEDAHVTAREHCRDGSPLVLYTGRFVDRKGVRELLMAIPRVLERVPGTRFAFVGGYGSGAEIEREWLPCELWPYREQIHFTGWLAPRETAAWYRAADILVVPSWYEPFGMVILEGMLYGLPIAATAVGGPAEILEDGRTGILFPPKDPEALGEAVLRLVEHPDLRRQLGAAAAAEVRLHWLWPRIVGKMRRVYQEIVREPVQTASRRDTHELPVAPHPGDLATASR
ncbi:MAG: glycosyltransferase family 4 protein [Chloroflexota bacterium]